MLLLYPCTSLIRRELKMIISFIYVNGFSPNIAQWMRLAVDYILSRSACSEHCSLRNMKKLTPEQREMVWHAHQYFASEKEQGNDPLKRALQQRVEECLHVGEATVSRVMASYRSQTANSPEPSPASAVSGDGDGDMNDGESYDEFFLSVIRSHNLRRLPTTAANIRAEVLRVTGDDLSLLDIQKRLKELGCSYIKGKTRDPRADSAAVVKLCDRYLVYKMQNYNRRSNPCRPEAFLDESYCNLHHVASRSWVLPDKIRYMRSGEGERYCIVGAGVIRVKNGKMHGGWVPGSVQHWPACRTDQTADYYGNFDSVLFEKWFEKLCATLVEEYGPCNIHMDGASYHKRHLNPCPTKQWRKSDMQAWLLENGVFYDPRATKANLMAAVERNRPDPIYTAVAIAQRYGHKVLYAPPYHPETQPIELVWGAIKNHIAQDPALTMDELGEKITAGIKAISSRTWLQCYRKVQQV